MPIVKEWKASYYLNSSLKWLHGTIAIYPAFVRFIEQYSRGQKSIDFRIYFDEFIEMKREKTTIFYAAITIRIKTEKYWFSSFRSCTEVYNTIEHFWRERLIDSSEDDGEGKEMLKVLHNSQDTLLTAAKALHKQGQQIDEACRTMNKLHGNLNVAETLIHSMGSWLSQWHVNCPKVNMNVSGVRQCVKKIEFTVLYGLTRDEKHHSGILEISENGVELLSSSHEPLHYFGIREISEIIVHTPWEMTVAKYCIGKPDVTFHIMSSRLIYILQQLEYLVGAKISYEEPPDHIEKDEFKSRECSQASLKCEDAQQGSSTVCCSDEIQLKQKTVSDRDADEMSHILKNMKSMALGIQQEQDRQSQQIDLLSDSVDKANERIRNNSQRVKHLM